MTRPIIFQISQWGAIGSLLTSTTFLLYQYRLGSVRVDGSNVNPGIRDIGAYIRAGNSILARSNPYTDSGIRVGPAASIPFSFLDTISSEKILVTVWQLITLVGFISLYFVLSKKKNGLSLHVTSVILLFWFSSVRENLVTCQVSGLIAMCFSSLILAMKSSRALWARNLVIISISSFLIDLKPHLTLIPLFLMFVQQKKIRLFMAALLNLVIQHFILDLYTGQSLEILWLASILKTPAVQGQTLSDSHTFWPIILYFTGNAQFIILVSLLLQIMLAVKLYKIRNLYSMESYFILCLFLPSFLTYFHFYDLSLVATLVFAQVINLKKLNLKLFICLSNFLILGSSSHNYDLLIISFFCLSLFCILNMKKFYYFRWIHFFFWFITSATFNFLILDFSPVDLRHSIKVTSSCVVLLVSYFVSQRFSIDSDKENKTRTPNK